ncbi:U4/U6 small nuclear ribonucleoprotein Prp31 [Cucurbitaria berberidis CBS 394.84]|uniref:U4/U6 small nuclear ribonucleo protein Prp31 n=1 Tax=Cucurbitaria berberidis CBS 394.84 TaxID=1168544 RepID=A0A9P4L3L7_9PLEO|nr:U4/U6 small nuclear ribonucleoprotein Prp31 [Cucurbitaria berberidis CBS 394.84]KAF1841071.1 U4/U6 small nuclear ribonucleo protein Prp31 [Cucurbitaria berberidis CBS 394.84]
MATLEQELMADFADSGDEDVADLENDFGEAHDSPEADGDDDAMVDEEAEYEAEQKKLKKGPADIRGAQNLMTNLEPVLQQIDEVKDRMEEVMDGESIEDNPEYQLLKEANEYSTQIDGEIAAVHKFIRDHYSQRFPYLEELIKNPVSYAKTVAILQNGPFDDIKTIAQKADNLVGVPLKSILDGPLLMVVIVEGTRIQTSDLTETELEVIVGACQLLLYLDKARGTLISYVQSRMTIFAPNLTALVGSLTGSSLIASAGGLAGLAKTPACNIAPLGSNRSTGLGLSTNIGIRNQGYLFHSQIIREIRQDLKKQALRIVAAKVILAARVDFVHSAADGSTGLQLKEDCERRLEKLGQAPPNQGVRALPTPDDKPSRKRGGRRARKAKEATALTEIRKAQNRMAFGKEEKEVGYGDSVKGMGMIGATDTGRLRAQQIDPKTRAKLSKKNPGWGGDTTLGAASSLKGFGAGGTATSLRAQGLRTGGVGLGGAGTSSIAFTPVQGLELVDPKKRDEMQRKRKADEDRWFKGGSFTNLNGGASKVDAGGFKVPALPNKKAKTDS